MISKGGVRFWRRVCDNLENYLAPFRRISVDTDERKLNHLGRRRPGWEGFVTPMVSAIRASEGVRPSARSPQSDAMRTFLRRGGKAAQQVSWLRSRGRWGSPRDRRFPHPVRGADASEYRAPPGRDREYGARNAVTDAGAPSPHSGTRPVTAHSPDDIPRRRGPQAPQVLPNRRDLPNRAGRGAVVPPGHADGIDPGRRWAGDPAGAPVCKPVSKPVSAPRRRRADAVEAAARARSRRPTPDARRSGLAVTPRDRAPHIAGPCPRGRRSRCPG